MNPLSNIEPAGHAATKSLSSTKEGEAREGELLFASYVDVADPLPAASLLPLERDGEPALPERNSIEGDAKAKLPGEGIAVQLTNVTVASAQNEADLGKRIDETARSFPPSKGEVESPPRAVTTGLSAAQAVVEGRIVQLPNADLVKEGGAQSALPEMAPDAVPPKRAEAQIPLPYGLTLQGVPKDAVLPFPTLDPAAQRLRSWTDRAVPATAHQPKPVLLPLVTTQAKTVTDPAFATARGVVPSEVDLSQLAVNAVDQEGLQGLVALERPTITTSAAGIGAPAGTETARHAAHQLATAIVHSNGKATEIALNPEELGRVRLTLSAADGALTLVVLADRPETQDLLRRHIDVLAQEFRSLGYDSVSFSFSADGQSGNPDDNESSDEDATALSAASIETEVPVNGGVKTFHWGGAKAGHLGARALDRVALI